MPVFAFLSDQSLPENLIRLCSIPKTLSDSDAPSLFNEGQNLTRILTFEPVVECKKTSGRQFVECMCAAKPHPVRVKIAGFENANLFLATIYRFMTVMSTNDKASKMVTAPLDTGSGPNLDREYVLPTPWLAKVPPILAIIRAGSGTTLRVAKVIQIKLKVGDTNPV